MAGQGLRLRVLTGAALLASLPGCDLVFGVDPAPDAGPVAPSDAPPAPPAWRQISAGRNHSCGIDDATAALWCWGQNDRGQLGDGSTRDRNRPAPVFVIMPRMWDAVAAGGEHTCAIEDGGALWCWGGDARGQVGDGPIAGAPILLPVRVSADRSWVKVAAGDTSTCAIDDVGALACWGNGSDFRLGNGVSDDEFVPTPVTAPMTTWTDVAIYDKHACGIANGNVFCWGNNDVGQVTGVATAGDSTEFPVEVMTGALDVDVGGSHTCAIHSGSGTMRCWGADGSGQFGDGNSVSGPAPVDLDSAGPFAQVDLAFGSTCGLRPTGELLCWGENYYGVIGLGDPLVHTLPVPIVPGTTWKQVTTQVHHACALTESGQLWCTGRDHVGQLGLGTGGPVRQPVMLAGGGGELLAVGTSSACEARGGQVWCWGDNLYGAAGAPVGVLAWQSPGLVPGASGVSSLAVGHAHTCAARAGLQTLCWGFGGEGALGNGQGTTSPVPTAASGLMANEVAAARHTCALVAGTVWCWGNNDSGAVDQSGTTRVMSPAQLAVSDATLVTAGGAHSCVRRSSGDITCWGSNLYGQLGSGDANDVNGPVTGPGSRTMVAAGFTHTCTIDVLGEAYCWGDHSYGQVSGEPVGGTVLSPTHRVDRPVGVDGWSAIATGRRHTCALTKANELYCWGSNAFGELGHGGSDDPAPNPTRVPHPEGGSWVRVAVGGYTTCAHDSNQRLWCWGANYQGQVGNGTTWRTAWTQVTP